MRVICVDFETANRFCGSICSVGLAIVDGITVTGTKYWLVRPHPEHFYFEKVNTAIHGLNTEHLKYEQEFNRIYGEIKPYFEDAIIVAHNAEFDISALKTVLSLYNITCPEINYLCTHKIAAQAWKGLDSYKLNKVCEILGFNFKHHYAEADAMACAKVLIAALSEMKVSTVEELADKLGLRFGKLYDGGQVPCEKYI